MGAFCVLTAALSAFRLGASGGELLVPPRSSARMRPKGGAVGKADNFTERLPPAIVRLDSLRDAPPSLRNPSRPQNQYNLCAAFRRVRGAIPKFFPVRFNEENQIFGHFLFEYPIARVFHASVRTGADSRTGFGFCGLFSLCENSKETRLIIEFKMSNVLDRIPLKHCFSNVNARRRGFSRGAVRRAANLMNRLPVAIAPLIHRLCGGG